MDSYVTKDGDRLDQIVYQRYGTVDVLPLVLDANQQRGIAGYGLVFGAGVTLVMPRISAPAPRQRRLTG